MQLGIGIMQMPPDVFWNLSMIEFSHACEGFSKFNSNQSNAPMTKDELQDLMERYPD